MKKLYIIFIITFLIMIPSVEASSEGNKIADAGAKLAVGINENYKVKSPSTKVNDPAAQKYINARDKLIAERSYLDGDYASCDVTVSTIIRYSGVDPNFEPFAVPKQWDYMEASDSWKMVGRGYHIGDNSSNLQPGDVLVVDRTVGNQEANMHIWIYLGNKAVQKYWPGNNSDSIQGSYSSTQYEAFYPSLFKASESWEAANRSYVIFRYDGEDYAGNIKHWAEMALNQGIFQLEKVDTCNLISETFQETLDAAFKYISVAGIILLIILTIIDLIKIIAGNPIENFVKFGQNIKARIITLIILLILPFLITFILDTVNNVASIAGYQSDNPLCGVITNN